MISISSRVLSFNRSLQIALGNMDLDPLTGGSYDREKIMYMTYHGLSEEQAAIVMGQTTYSGRDAMCNMFIELNSVNNLA